MTPATLPRTTPSGIGCGSAAGPLSKPTPTAQAAARHDPLVTLTPVDEHGRQLFPSRLTRTRRRDDGQLEAVNGWHVEGPAVIARCRVTDIVSGHSWIEELDHGIARIEPGHRTAILVRVWWQP